MHIYIYILLFVYLIIILIPYYFPFNRSYEDLVKLICNH